jgi:hypothetical protein
MTQMVSAIYGGEVLSFGHDYLGINGPQRFGIRETMESVPEYLRKHRKHFIPLESNPEVFTSLIHKLGVSNSLEFQDVLSLDDPELLAFLPRPAYALVLVFPTTEAYHRRVETEDTERQLETDNKAGSDILYFKQTINNACGLYGILHAVCNGEASTKLGMYVAGSCPSRLLIYQSARLDHRQDQTRCGFTHNRAMRFSYGGKLRPRESLC